MSRRILCPPLQQHPSDVNLTPDACKETKCNLPSCCCWFQCLQDEEAPHLIVRSSLRGDERLPERTISQCCRHVGQHRVKLLSRERIGGLGWLQSDDAPPAIIELQRRSEERESGRCALTAALRAAATPPSGGHTEALHREIIRLDCWFIYLPCVCVGLFSLLKINKKKSISLTFMSHNLYGLKV